MLKRSWPGSLLLVFAVVLSLDSMAADELKPFTTDGCSAFPDGTIEQSDLWQQCCVEHDLAYWQGGTRDERKAADEALRACVTGVGEPAIAKLMMAGVRVGGTPYLPTRFRWGYGWPFVRGYGPLTAEEQAQVDALVPQPEANEAQP